jgi:hypothetical protein
MAVKERERVETAAERRERARQARSAAAKRLSEADAALTRALRDTSGDWMAKVRAERDLPALHVARAEAQTDHDAANLAARQADDAWLLDREQFYRPEHARAVASLVSAFEALLREHDRYESVWGRIRADGGRVDHAGWPLVTGRVDLRADIEACRLRLRQRGWLGE